MYKPATRNLSQSLNSWGTEEDWDRYAHNRPFDSVSKRGGVQNMWNPAHPPFPSPISLLLKEKCNLQSAKKQQQQQRHLHQNVNKT